MIEYNIEYILFEYYDFLFQCFSNAGEWTNFLSETANDCDFVFMDETFFKSNFGFAFAKGSPYTKYFSRG